MSSITISITGNSSQLHADFYPEIVLDERYEYSCSMLSFNTYNSIPNVHKHNNVFHYSLKKEGPYEEITIPIGAYELEAIVKLLTKYFEDKSISFYIHANSNTLKCSLKGIVYIDFSKPNSIGKLLGFDKRILTPSKQHTSDHVVNIQSVNNVRIDCDLTTGSFHNGQSTHTIYEFSPPDPGYKIDEQTKHLIYLPITKRRINEVNISVVDQNGQLVDFRGEEISCRIHIKRDP